MLKNWKLIAGTAVTLLLSGLVINPVEANTVDQVAPSSSYERNQLSEDEAIYRVTYPVGVVRTIEGNMINVQLMDGQTVVYEISPADMETWKLYAGSYVLVDEDDNKILDVVYEGEIKSIVGTVVTVELENGELETYGVDRRELGAMNLIEGQDLYVTKSQILALAPEPDVTADAYLINTTRSTTIYPDTQAESTEQPMDQAADYNQPQETQMNQMNQNQMYQQPDTMDRQDSYQQSEEPVRGMW